MRPGLRISVVAAVMATLVSCTTSAAERRPESVPTTQEPSAPPAVVKDCWVPAGAGNVSLTGEQARALTTSAATLGRLDRAAPDRISHRLATAVARVADVDPATAREVAGGLAGLSRASRLNCSYARMSVQPQEPGPGGLVPRARRLRAAWTAAFGALPAGGFGRGGVSTGHVDGSAHYEGRAIDVFFRPLGDDEQRRRGWVFAQWLVAHAPDHHVLSVIYDDHIWTSWAAVAGWRDYVHPGATYADRGDAVLRHREHVHVAVESGRPYRGR